MTYGDLSQLVAGISSTIAGARRIAVWATPRPETCVAVLGALACGAAVVPLNPRSGPTELGHVLADSAPELILAAPDAAMPDTGGIDVMSVALDSRTSAASLPPEPPEEQAAFVMYTSGTTGPPKGAILSRRAVAANLDALAAVWAWTADDVLVHGLPLFHVHGLILGVLGPLRAGGRLHHTRTFSPEAAAAALRDGATMLFGVPTMYHRLADAAVADSEVATALAGARLLVSGSAALARHDHDRIVSATGRGVAERYGMTETLITAAVPASVGSAPGSVGPALPGTELRLVDDDGTLVAGEDEPGAIEVRGPSVFDGYLNRADVTAAVYTEDGWFRTGDVATLGPDGFVTIVGREATDLIKTGGFKVGAGEIEDVLVGHPGVAEAAVTAVPDDDLGERVEAWVVASPGAAPRPVDLIEHVAAYLAPHKRPRAVHIVGSLPRNDMGKVVKTDLRT